MARRSMFAVLCALALVAAACGARFEDDGSGGLASGPAGDSGETAPASTTTPTGPGPAPGVTETTIKIGYLLPLTGAAPIPSRFDKGVNAYWNYVNEQGGIDGRAVEVVVEDTQSQAEVGKDKAKKLIEDDQVFAVVVLDRLENQEAIGALPQRPRGPEPRDPDARPTCPPTRSGRLQSRSTTRCRASSPPTTS